MAEGAAAVDRTENTKTHTNKPSHSLTTRIQEEQNNICAESEAQHNKMTPQRLSSYTECAHIREDILKWAKLIHRIIWRHTRRRKRTRKTNTQNKQQTMEIYEKSNYIIFIFVGIWS